jgi:hypothetical protein
MRLKRYARRLRAFRKEMAVSGDDAVTERALAEACRAKGMSAEAGAATQRGKS